MQPRPHTATKGRYEARALVALAVGLVLAASWRPARAEDLHETAQALKDKYAQELAGLAAWCDERGLADQAQQVRDSLRPRDPYTIYVAVLPDQIGRKKLPADASADLVEWDTRWARLQRDQANSLYELARRTIRAGGASLAFDLVLAALRENPDHEAIRRLLGYQAYRGHWRTAYEVHKLRTNQVWHDRFGWLPNAYVKRYEQGQRYYKGRWISAEEDAGLHADIRAGWEINTEHYTVLTNHSLQSGVRLSRQLERLYRVWKQLFIRFYASKAQVAALFAGSARRPQFKLPRHEVVYFRDREDYVQSLRAGFPNIERSIGLYADRLRRAYFFAGMDREQQNLQHEATHQLFHESRPVAPNVGQSHNFWICEGIALYMETLREENGYYVLGGLEDQRILDAAHNLLAKGFYVPLSQFTALGMDEMQHHEQVATLYSQAAGLTCFLIHYESGRYRDTLVAYLSAVYNGRDNPNTLAQLTGTPYADLDRQYRDFLQNVPQQPAD